MNKTGILIAIFILFPLINAQSMGLNLSAKWDSGQNQIITTITNIDANSGASYDVFATCTNGFTQSGNSQRISGLEIGSSQIIYIGIVGGTNSGDCEIKIVDVNQPNNYVFVNVPVQVTNTNPSEWDFEKCGNGQQVCNPNADWCDNGVKMRCNQCGTEYFKIGACENNSSDNGKFLGYLIYIIIFVLSVFGIYYLVKKSKKK